MEDESMHPGGVHYVLGYVVFIWNNAIECAYVPRKNETSEEYVSPKNV